MKQQVAGLKSDVWAGGWLNMHAIRENRKSGQGSLFQCSVKMQRNVCEGTSAHAVWRQGTRRGGEGESMQDMGQESGLEKMREEKEVLLEFFYVQEQLNKFLISWKPELKGEMVQQQDDIKGRLWRILRTYTNAFIALIAYLRSSSTEQSHQNSNLLRQKEGKVIVVISKENKKEQFRGMRKAKENMIICKRIIRVEKIQRVKWRKWSNE